MTGELAVCAGSCGPGNLHLINGLYDANRCRVPVLAIAAHIPSAEIGSDLLPGDPPAGAVPRVSVYVEYVADPRQMPRMLEIAMRTAIERRGVAVLVIPGDVASAEAVHDRRTVVTKARSAVVRRPGPAAGARQRCSTPREAVTILAGPAAPAPTRR